MSLIELLKDKSQTSVFVLLDDLPERPELKMLSYELKTDKRGNEGIFITFEDREGRRIVQKYGASVYEMLLALIAKVGGERVIKESYITYEKRTYGRQDQNRLYPVVE